MAQEFDIVQEVLAQFDDGNDLVDDVLAELGMGAPVQQFDDGGSVRGFAQGGDLPTELKVTGTKGLTPGTNYSTGYDVGAWDADAFLATQSNQAATAGLLEGVEIGQMKQQQDRRDALKKELAKKGLSGKVNFLSNDQVNDLYNKMKTGVTLTKKLVDSYKITTANDNADNWLDGAPSDERVVPAD